MFALEITFDYFLVPYLTNQNTLLVSAVSMGIGLIAKCISLPLDDGIKVSTDSPDAKRPANCKITKKQIVDLLFDVMNNIKYPSKVRERAARSLGLFCVGELYLGTKDVIQGFLNTAKEVNVINIIFFFSNFALRSTLCKNVAICKV